MLIKLPSNFDKTEMILFKPTKKPLDCQLKLKLNGKRLHQLNILELKLINILIGRII